MRNTSIEAIGHFGEVPSTPEAGPLVSVIIPAKDAEATLDRTLLSVRGQLHDNLEIIVVDDTSSDGTVNLVEQHAAQDKRIRLLRNSVCLGVGGSRNRGAAEASGQFLSFIDADDLMAPASISARLAELVRTGSGMCYSWSAIIDENDRVIDTRFQPTFEGDIYRQLALAGNFIGNGSSCLVTREAFEAVGGYSDKLFKAGAQGCEDYQFHLDVARAAKVACVPEFHIGYRETPYNMSSDPVRMMKSMLLVQEAIAADFPGNERLFGMVRDGLRIHIAMKALRARQIGKAAALFMKLGTRLPVRVLRYFMRTIAVDDSKMPHGSVFPFSQPGVTAASTQEAAV